MILVPRETPWSLIHARNVVTLLEAGAILLPAIPSFYSRPSSVDAVADTVVWRILDQIGLPNPRAYRWRDDAAKTSAAKLKIEGWRARLLIGLDIGLFRLWVRTLRSSWTIAADVVGLVSRSASSFSLSGIIGFLLLPSVFRRLFPARRQARLDQCEPRWRSGLAALIERFGYGTVRGSTSRKGPVHCLAPTGRRARRGTHIVITPDGPRGPVYQLSQGVIFLAQKSGAPVVPSNMEYSSCWRFKSWDRFIRAASFCQSAGSSSVPTRRSEPTRVRKNSSSERLRLQNAMMSLVERK